MQAVERFAMLVAVVPKVLKPVKSPLTDDDMLPLK
jgi:hypothetical protein